MNLGSLRSANVAGYAESFILGKHLGHVRALGSGKKDGPGHSLAPEPSKGERTQGLGALSHRYG